MSRSKVLFFLSGSIAAFKACQVISRLVQSGCEVQTVATASALKFIGSATLEGLTGKPVLSDIFAEGRAMDHIHLTRWADYGVLCPASATTIARLANGLADDLVSAMALAWPRGKALHVFPAMNTQMWGAPQTQSNIQKLSEFGFTVHGVSAGNLACGEEGAGRLLEPEEILRLLKPQTRGKILITGGATREPLDGIRYISNVSTGQTAATLADQLSAKGWDVTYLSGLNAARSAFADTQITFSSFADLDEKLHATLSSQNFTGVIHCAAVSDYSVASVNGQTPDAASKISSDEDLQIEFRRNGKILPHLKEYSRNKNIRVVGFKLGLNTTGEELHSAARSVLSQTVDAVVANDWSQVVANRSAHPGTLLHGKSEQKFHTLPELAGYLDQIFNEGVQNGPVS